MISDNMNLKKCLGVDEFVRYWYNESLNRLYLSITVKKEHVVSYCKGLYRETVISECQKLISSMNGDNPTFYIGVVVSQCGEVTYINNMVDYYVIDCYLEPVYTNSLILFDIDKLNNDGFIVRIGKYSSRKTYRFELIGIKWQD